MGKCQTDSGLLASLMQTEHELTISEKIIASLRRQLKELTKERDLILRKLEAYDDSISISE